MKKRSYDLTSLHRFYKAVRPRKVFSKFVISGLSKVPRRPIRFGRGGGVQRSGREYVNAEFTRLPPCLPPSTSPTVLPLTGCWITSHHLPLSLLRNFFVMSSSLPVLPQPLGSASSMSSPNKKRRIDQPSDGDIDFDDSAVSPESDASPSKSGRRKATDPERRARLEARQARNRLSAQYSRERKKAYMDELEGSVSALKSENDTLRKQAASDALIRTALEAKLKDCESRVSSLENLIRNLVNPSKSASPATFTLAPTVSAVLQSVNNAHKSGTCPSTIAAPASIGSLSPSSGTLVQQSLNEDVRLPAAEATCSDAPSHRDAELGQSQQRMSSLRSMVLPVQRLQPVERKRASSTSMAAASSQTRFNLSTLVNTSQLSRSRRMHLKLNLSSPTTSTSLKLVTRRRLVLRIKVPRRLPAPLTRYLLARSLRHQQLAQQEHQTPATVSTMA